MKCLLPFIPLLAAGSLGADTLVLSDFSSFTLAPDAYLGSAFGDGLWSGATAADNGDGTFTIGDFGAGAPGGAAGNGFALFLTGFPEWSTSTFVELTGFAGPSNATPQLSLYLEDATDPFNFALTTFDLSAFTSGFTMVSAPLALGAIDPANVGRWGFIVSEFDNPEFNFTFDHIQLVSVPEPASTAALLAASLFAAGAAVRRRRKTADERSAQ